jgi:hypothetical protein
VSKLINEPVTVHIKNNAPTAFIWRRRNYRVIEVIYRWWEPARWWDGENARLLVQLLAANGTTTGIYELAKHDADWYLLRVLD